MRKITESSLPEWDRAHQLGAHCRTGSTNAEAAPLSVCAAWRNLVAAQNDILQLRDGIAARMRFRFKDVERLRSLGVDPLYRYRVFEVDRTSDEILAIWCARDGVRAPPHWSEITAYLDRLIDLVGYALSNHDSLHDLPQAGDMRVLMIDAALLRFAEQA